MKYSELTLGQVEAIVNKLGGMDGIQRFLRGELTVLKSGSVSIVPINHSTPFNPAEFIGKGWTIEEQDERSLELVELDLTKVRLETMLRGNELSIVGEEKLARLKNAGYVRLDAKIFQTLWESKHLIPEDWKGKAVFFDGTILRGPGGSRCVLYLCWDGGRWDWNYYWLGLGWDAGDPSAVLAS